MTAEVSTDELSETTLDEPAVKMTVLIVDDSPMDRHIAGRIVDKDVSLKAVYASNGAAALKAIERSAPAAVVTDLQMPDVDGLELVEEIRQRFPQIPVVLMTGHGSEEIAIRALQRGAASYVAKRFLAQDLRSTLHQVLNAAKKDRRQQLLLDSMTAFECRFALANDPAMVPMVVAYLQEHVARLGVCGDAQRTRVGIALEEALLNALYHGNLELSSDLRQDGDGTFQRLARERRDQAPYMYRRVDLRARIDSGEAVFVIGDEGPGFDPSSLPDPTAPENLEKASGRGLLLIRTFMDEVTHNAAGNEITLVKRRTSSH